MTRDKMLAHAEHWIAAWNRRDVDAVLQAFDDNASFISPKAASLVGTTRLENKRAIGEYWRLALANIGVLEFRLDHVVCDVERRKMIVFYQANLNGSIVRACELVRFDAAGRQVFGEALYGAAA